MSSFNAAEVAALKDGRQLNPKMGQRTLARKLYDQAGLTGENHPLRFRSGAAIYSALRRFDKKTKAAVARAVQAVASPA